MSDGRNSSETSSDDDELDGVPAASPPGEISGTLSKWTNYIHGWQDRHTVIKDGVMTYYKSRQDTSFGCRGSISIEKAIIKVQSLSLANFVHRLAAHSARLYYHLGGHYQSVVL